MAQVKQQLTDTVEEKEERRHIGDSWQRPEKPPRPAPTPKPNEDKPKQQNQQITIRRDILFL